jgi:uncharacterized protein
MSIYIQRKLKLENVLLEKSCFLFGPRQTGKSSLIEHTLSKKTIIYNLLESDLFLKLQKNPEILRKELLVSTKSGAIVVIDEIQKIPALLNEVHALIETHKLRFLLTGSSARKLRRAGVNLLGGRARVYNLKPLSFHEIGTENFDLLKALNRGLIPSIYFSKLPAADLRSYVSTYIKEEIAAEALTRNIPAFARFLHVAASCNGTLLSPTSISNECGVPKSTVSEYFEILEDTLIGEKLPAWKKSSARKAIEANKFYFFDCGVARHLSERPPVKEKSVDFGDAFEHFVFQELKAYIEYIRPGTPLHYWRSTSGFEVDFILGESVAIEVKASFQAGQKELRGLKALSEEKKMKKYILVCREERARLENSLYLILPWKIFLFRLWNNELIEKEEEI